MQFLIDLSELTCHSAIGVYRKDMSYLVVKTEADVYVYHNSCPHLGIPLEWLPNQFLDEDGELIRCATHGALFTIEDGLCISGPCNGRSLRAVDHVIRNQKIFVLE